MSRNKAFLSYRHVKKDEKLAALLQRELENYRFSGKNKPTAHSNGGVGRIFRDTTDLGAKADLTAQLRRELDDSEYLIVLCSRDAVGSKWIEREIWYFLQSHEAEKILPVLADGEPEEILPAMFGGIEGMPRHPIACDFRGSRRKAMREELPRLAAALLDCPYDELINRRRRFEARRQAAVTAGIFLILSAVIIYYAAMSAQIRKSLREKQIGESESLAVQSETALSQRLRLDAVRYALDALPEKEGDSPVTQQAVLALQKAVAAYVPEGNRMLAQMGEYRVTGRIQEFTVGEMEGTVYLAAVCAEYGEKYTLLWNVDTGETLYDSRRAEEPSGRPGKSVAGKTTGMEVFLDGGMLIQKDYLTWPGKTPGSYNRLRGVDIRTGKIVWQEYVENTSGCFILDVQEGAVVLLLEGTLQEEPALIGEASAISEQHENNRSENNQYENVENTDEELKKGLENGRQRVLRYQELQLRSTKDGSVLCSRISYLYSDEKHYRVEETAVSGGREKPAVFFESTYRADPTWPVEEETEKADLLNQTRLVSLDPETGKERLLLEADGDRSIVAVRETSDGHALAVLSEKPEYQDLKTENKIKKDPYADGTQISYTGAGKECLTVCCIDLQTGELLWEMESTSVNNLKVLMIEDLQIEGKKVCALSSGTRTDIFAQDTGERLYSFEFPALPVCLRTGQYEGKEAMEAVLQDGSRAWDIFSDREVLRKENVFPGDIFSAQVAGGKYFFLSAEDRNLVSNGRICVFGEDVYDEEIPYVLDSEGERIHLSIRPSHIYDEKGNLTSQNSAGGLFLLADLDGIARGVDARTGKTCWEVPLSDGTEYVEYVGVTGDDSRMVFQDYGTVGRIAFLQSDGERPSKKDLWKILDTRDGHIMKVINPVEDVFGYGPGLVLRAAVGGDALVLIVACKNEEKPENFDYWFLRHCLSDGKTEAICLSSYGEDIHDKVFGELSLLPSPDGLSTVFTFFEDTEEMEPFNFLVDWKSHRITRLQDSPLMDAGTTITYSRDSSRIGLYRPGGLAAIYSAEGVLQQIFKDNTGEGIDNENIISGDERKTETETGTRLLGIGFWQEKLFLLQTSEKELHFRIPGEGTDILLPSEGLLQYELDEDIMSKEIPLWELPDHKLLLIFRSMAYVFDPGTGVVEAVNDDVAAYNPETDTMLLMDKYNALAIAPRYSWKELLRKGQRILGE